MKISQTLIRPPRKARNPREAVKPSIAKSALPSKSPAPAKTPAGNKSTAPGKKSPAKKSAAAPVSAPTPPSPLAKPPAPPTPTAAPSVAKPAIYDPILIARFNLQLQPTCRACGSDKCAEGTPVEVARLEHDGFVIVRRRTKCICGQIRFGPDTADPIAHPIQKPALPPPAKHVQVAPPPGVDLVTETTCPSCGSAKQLDGFPMVRNTFQKDGIKIIKRQSHCVCGMARPGPDSCEKIEKKEKPK